MSTVLGHQLLSLSWLGPAKLHLVLVTGPPRRQLVLVPAEASTWGPPSSKLASEGSTEEEARVRPGAGPPADQEALCLQEEAFFCNHPVPKSEQEDAEAASEAASEAEAASAANVPVECSDADRVLLLLQVQVPRMYRHGRARSRAGGAGGTTGRHLERSIL